MMNNLPLSIKYRPKKLAEVVGQEAVVKILANSIKSNNLHHAYLFQGHTGSGKTSVARIFAASINSPLGPTLDPERDSDLVKKIYDGKCFDIIEIDAASNRGIEDVRELRNRIQYSPTECRCRFVIIDECHALTGAAAEAALKMIEEPPRDVIFILATTDAQKLKATIHNRCLPLRFNKVHWNQIFGHLISVAKKESMDFEENALKIAARVSGGSIRNALQNLQLLATYVGSSKITEVIASQVLSAVDDNKYFELIDCVIKNNAGEAMRILDVILGDGKDVVEIIKGIVAHLRNLLVISTASSTNGLLFLTEEEKKKYIFQRQGVSIELIVEMMTFLQEVNKGLMLNMNAQILLETFIVKSIIFAARANKLTT